MMDVPKESGAYRRRLARRVAVVITAGLGVAAAACSDSTSPSKRVDGVYGLETVSGQALPFTFDSTASSKIQIISATINVVTGSGGTRLLETEVDAVIAPGQPTVTNTSGDTATVSVDENGQFANTQLSGSFTTGGLSLIVGGSQFVFWKAAVDPP